MIDAVWLISGKIARAAPAKIIGFARKFALPPDMQRPVTWRFRNR
jgi:hypothetical protein